MFRTLCMRPDVAAIAPAAMRVDLVDTVDGFRALESHWDELLAASRSDCFFLTWEWLYAWWRHMRGDRALQLLVVREGDELVGVAPLARARTTLPWLSRLEFLGTGYAGSDYVDVIVRRDRELQVVEALSRAIAAQNVALHLDHLPSESVSSALLGNVEAEGWTSIRTPGGICPFVRLEGRSWDSYLASVGPAHRANLRRRIRGLDREFQVRFERVSSEPARAAALETLMSLHNRRWDKRGGSTAFPTPACRAFHDEATRRALDRGWLRLYVLTLDGTPAAATYCFAYNDRFYFYQGAFDERFAQHSVGMVAMGLTIRAATEEGAREFDMLYGVETYKWLWARDARALDRIDLFPAHIGGRLHHRTIEAERTVRTLARRIFPRKTCNSNVLPAGVVC